MMPQPMAILLVSRATMAVVAVEERASIECLRHQGYASASQKTSNPAASQARAMCTVSWSGSMLNCRTPILKGKVIVLWSQIANTADLEIHCLHAGSLQECSRPLINCHIARFSGV